MIKINYVCTQADIKSCSEIFGFGFKQLFYYRIEHELTGTILSDLKSYTPCNMATRHYSSSF